MHTGELKRSNRVLHSYSNHKVKPDAAVELLVKYKNWETRTEFEIVNIECAQGHHSGGFRPHRVSIQQSKTGKKGQVAVRTF